MQSGKFQRPKIRWDIFPVWKLCFFLPKNYFQNKNKIISPASHAKCDVLTGFSLSCDGLIGNASSLSSVAKRAKKWGKGAQRNANCFNICAPADRRPIYGEMGVLLRGNKELNHHTFFKDVVKLSSEENKYCSVVCQLSIACLKKIFKNINT
jgi:hypothetical protein